MNKSDFKRYLASREWAILKEQVRARAGGICERCKNAPIDSTHHVTYERIGCELLEDLLGVCEPCHQFISAKSDVDPAASVEPTDDDTTVTVCADSTCGYCLACAIGYTSEHDEAAWTELGKMTAAVEFLIKVGMLDQGEFDGAVKHVSSGGTFRLAQEVRARIYQKLRAAKNREWELDDKTWQELCAYKDKFGPLNQ